MTLWIITRIPQKRSDGLKLGMWDPDTGLPRQGYPIGYIKSEKEAEKLVAYYRRYGSMHYKYQVQTLDEIGRAHV